MDDAEIVTKRSDWCINHESISRAFVELLIEKNGHAASQLELAERTGLSRETVAQHLQSIDYKSLFGDLTVKAAANEVFATITREAIAGNMTAAKLYLKAVLGWSEKQTVDIEQITPSMVRFIHPSRLGEAMRHGFISFKNLSSQQLQELANVCEEQKVHRIIELRHCWVTDSGEVKPMEEMTVDELRNEIDRLKNVTETGEHPGFTHRYEETPIDNNSDEE